MTRWSGGGLRRTRFVSTAETRRTSTCTRMGIRSVSLIREGCSRCRAASMPAWQSFANVSRERGAIRMLTAGVLDALVLLDAPNLGFRGVLLLLAVLCAVGNWSPTV